jgi:hypothetical protein
MNFTIKKTFALLVMAIALLVTSCKKSDDGSDTEIPKDSDRWLTLAGALMQTESGDGNGGTMVYSVHPAEAADPNHEINVFDQGEHVKSNRTARLQASKDGKYLYNIQYTGADGGVFNKYEVLGGKNFLEVGSSINTAPYVGTSPRWTKVSEKYGVAVNVKDIVNVFEGEGEQAIFKGLKGTAVILVLDLENPRIVGTTEFEVALDAEEQLLGYHLYRLDAPVLNSTGDRLLIGTWMRKYVPGSTNVDASAPRLGTKTLIVDFPTLNNATIITSERSTGDNSGYRSPMSYLAEDGSIYQATHRELSGTGGSKIIRITPSMQYDANYELSLDQLLGVQNSYIETWKYVGDGIGMVIYSVDGNGGYLAMVDVRNKTITKIDLPNEDMLDFGQYQSIALHGDEVYVVVTPVSLNGNIYIVNRKTGAVKVGAKLINKTGNRYIGIY